MEPCTASEFDAEVIRYAARDGWAMRKVGRHRTDGFVGGERVLILAVVGGRVCHYRKPCEPGPIAPSPSGGSYK